MIPDLRTILELYLPFFVLGCAAMALTSVAFTKRKTSWLSTKFVLLGIFTFMLRLPMTILTQPDNYTGQSFISVVLLLSALFFLISLEPEPKLQTKKPGNRKKK